MLACLPNNFPIGNNIPCWSILAICQAIRIELVYLLRCFLLALFCSRMRQYIDMSRDELQLDSIWRTVNVFCVLFLQKSERRISNGMSVISIMPRMNRHTLVIIAIDQFVRNAFNCLSPIVVTTSHPVIRCFSSRGALRRHQRQLLVLQAG